MSEAMTKLARLEKRISDLQQDNAELLDALAVLLDVGIVKMTLQLPQSAKRVAAAEETYFRLRKAAREGKA